MLVEQSGTSVKALLTRPNLSGCLNPGCDIAEDGASHSRRGANYTGECTVCGGQYKGETGSGSAHTRRRSEPDTSSMAAHLSTEHPEYSRDPLALKFLSPGPGRASPHMEFVAPAIQRMTHTNLLGDGRTRGQG